MITSDEGLTKVIKNDIDKTIAAILRDVMENKIEGERLYFYFAGHGFGIESDNVNNGLCMSDWDDNYMFNVATLSSSDYKTKFTTEGIFKEVVMWLDCCRNTKLLATPAASSGTKLRGPNRQPRFFLAFATTYDNKAFEAFNNELGVKEPRGIFTSVLLEGLNGAAKGEDGKVTAESLTNYLYIHVPEAARKQKLLQEPEIHRNTSIVNNLIFS